MATGPQFLQTPGPSNVPPRVLAATASPTIDHRGPAFAELTSALLPRLQEVFGTGSAVVVYPSSGTGAWEAALTNCLSPGDRVLGFETGYFATLWRDMAIRLGLTVEFVPGDWRHGVDPAVVAERLTADPVIAAVMVVHNETSTGVRSPVAAVANVIRRTGHPALLLVDAVSSLGCMEYRHDEWSVDVTVSASQKGLMLPPGLGFNALSDKALTAAGRCRQARSYWDWRAVLNANRSGFFPYTPPTNLLFGLREALDMLLGEGLPAVYARHTRLATATRAAVSAWGLETVCADPTAHSDSVTGVLLPEGFPAAQLDRIARDRYNLVLGMGLGRLAGRAFRIGHLGYLNEAALLGALGATELALGDTGIPPPSCGVSAALAALR